eukprot:gi/632956290/ref/XP_007893884.1/ PREDICTED: uncharacterized protein LOC103180077 [Callorhinchus milii]
MEETVPMGDNEMRLKNSKTLPPRHQRTRCPFELINAFLCIICASCVVLVIYAMFYPPQDTGHLFIVIHASAETENIKKGMISLNSDEKTYFKNNSIIIPCDGIYVVYVLVASSQKTGVVKIEKKQGKAKWNLRNITFNTPLVMMNSLRRDEGIYLMTTENANITESETFLSIVLLHVKQDKNSCRKIWMKNRRLHNDHIETEDPVQGIPDLFGKTAIKKKGAI